MGNCVSPVLVQTIAVGDDLAIVIPVISGISHWKWGDVSSLTGIYRDEG